MDDLARKTQPNFVCYEISSYEDYVKYGINGCGNNYAYFYMMGYFIIFAVILTDLFIAVVLIGFEDILRLEEANLSEYYLSSFKYKWSEFDPNATGLIEVKHLRTLLVNIEKDGQLPFSTTKKDMKHII